MLLFGTRFGVGILLYFVGGIRQIVDRCNFVEAGLNNFIYISRIFVKLTVFIVPIALDLDVHIFHTIQYIFGSLNYCVPFYVDY